jgi:RND family efflux transporter MFP subunit
MNKKKTLTVFMGMVLITAVTYFVWSQFFKSDGEAKTTEESAQKDPGSPASVKLFTVKKTSFTDVLEGLIGTVKGNTIELTFIGQPELVTDIHVKVGDVVQKGKILMELDHTRTKGRKDQAETAYSRTKAMYRVGGATSHDLRDAKSAYDIAYKEYDYTFIRAPKSGYVSEINKEQGETVNPNETLLVLISTESAFHVETGVAEDQIENVRSGQKAYVKIHALGSEQEYKGEVTGLSREVTVTGRSGTVRISLPDDIQQRLRPGLSASCRIMVLNSSETFVIPRASYDPAKNGVYALDGSSAVFKPIDLGHIKHDYFQVKSGLNEGDRIVNSLATHPVKEGEKMVPEGEDVVYKGE